jgi:hypothetical protein
MTIGMLSRGDLRLIMQRDGQTRHRLLGKNGGLPHQPH